MQASSMTHIVNAVAVCARRKTYPEKSDQFYLRTLKDASVCKNDTDMKTGTSYSIHVSTLGYVDRGAAHAHCSPQLKFVALEPGPWTYIFCIVFFVSDHTESANLNF